MKEEWTWTTTDPEKASRLMQRENRRVLDGKAVCVVTWTEPGTPESGTLFQIRTFITDTSLYKAMTRQPEGVFS